MGLVGILGSFPHTKITILTCVLKRAKSCIICSKIVLIPIFLFNSVTILFHKFPSLTRSMLIHDILFVSSGHCSGSLAFGELVGVGQTAALGTPRVFPLLACSSASTFKAREERGVLRRSDTNMN